MELSVPSVRLPWFGRWARWTMAPWACALTLLTTFVDAASSNSLMDLTVDGKLLACANRDSNSITLIDLSADSQRWEITVGEKPEGLSFLGPSRTLAVAVYADDVIVFVDADRRKVVGRTEVFDEPYGVVSTPDGSKIYVTLEYPGQVVEIDSATQKTTRTFSAGSFPRGLALTPDGTHLLVTEYYSAAVHAIDLMSGEQTTAWEGLSTDNLARQIVLHPTRNKAYVPYMRSRVKAAHGQGSIFPYIAVVDTVPDGERKPIPMDAFRGNLVVANPWEIAVSPDGRHLYAVFSGTDDMFACDVIDDDYREIGLRQHIRLGKNPRAVRVSPDSKYFYVYNALDFNVVIYDAETLKALETIEVTKNPLGDEILAGKRLFYSALQPMVGRRWISCSSCHPDGDPDGRTWKNPEGFRSTPPLFGMAWTHPLHWSADRDETQDFEHTIRGPLMQGRGLISGGVNESLDAPNKGLSESLDALAAYTNSHKFTLSPHSKNGLTEAALRGQKLFHSADTGCATCHSGPFYTDSRPDVSSRVHDVGTGGDDPGEKMGPAYDTPTLLGIYRSAPYLHHGKAATLTELLANHNANDRHGKTSHLSAKQIADLVEFLKSLPFDDPEVEAKRLGMVPVTR